MMPDTPECTCRMGSANGRHEPGCPLEGTETPNIKRNPLPTAPEPETVVVEYKGCCQ